MQDITIKNIIDITNGKLLDKINQSVFSELMNTEINDIVIDSRKVTADSLFVAIKGENVDPHKFVPEVAKTCKAVIIDEDENEIHARSDGKELPEDVAYIKVDSSLDALQQIAAFVRTKYANKVIGVTGSVGKTTTREMISHALGSCLDVFHTEGNMNSQIGVPLTISHINDKPSDVAVLELGISEAGGMDRLTSMAMPDIGVVTMIGVAHIEFMKTQEGIREEKLRIAGRMNENGILFLNADDKLLWDIKGNTPVKAFYYGENPEADYRAENIRFENGYNSYDYVHDNTRIRVNLSALGRHNIRNSLVAMAICDYLGLDLHTVASSFETFKGLRQKIIQSDKGYTIIDDTYNASPDSMKAAISVLSDIESTGRRIAVLGDMYELGDNSDNYHSEVGSFIAEKNKEINTIDTLVSVGVSAKLISDAAGDTVSINEYFENKKDVIEYIKKIIRPGDVILLKASNGMKLSEIVDEII